MKKLKKRLAKLDMRFIFVALFVMVGAGLLLTVRAAVPTAHFEAESGTRTANATVGSDATASGGQYLRFNAVSDGSTSCPLPAYPDENCTGIPPGTSLTIVNGDFNVTANNQIVENKDVRGTIHTNNHTGVVIRKVKARSVYNQDVGNTDMRVLVEDSEFDCGGAGTAFGEANITLRRVDITNCENGGDVNQSITIEDSYIHELYENPAIDTHTDGIQMAGGHFVGSSIVNGALNVIIRHNTIYDYNRVSQLHGTSAIILNTSISDTNVLIENNLLAGGAYTLYCRYNGPAVNVRVINNHFSTIFSPSVAAYGPWTDCEDEAQVTGNVYHESGLPVPF